MVQAAVISLLQFSSTADYFALQNDTEVKVVYAYHATNDADGGIANKHTNTGILSGKHNLILLAMSAKQPSSTVSGIQPSSTVSAIQPSSTVSGIQPSSTVSPIQPSSTVSGIQPSSTASGIQPSQTVMPPNVIKVAHEDAFILCGALLSWWFLQATMDLQQQQIDFQNDL